MVAAVASEDPQIVPKAAQAPTAAIAMPPRMVAEQRIGATKQPRRQSGPRGHVAHQQEQRDHRKGIAGEGLKRRGLEEAQQRRQALDPDEAADADRQHGHADRHAQPPAARAGSQS